MVKIRVEGLRELDRALGQLPRATGKNVLRRVGRNALQPIIDDAKTKVHTGLTGNLKSSLAVSTKLSSAQKKKHRKTVRGDKSSIEIFAGAGPHNFVPQAIFEEFGVMRGKSGKKSSPHPFLRPAWDAGKMKVLGDIKKDLWTEIKKAADRVARKKARALKG